MSPGIKGNYFKVAEAISKSHRETWRNDLYDRVFASDIDNERVKHLVAEIKAYCRELYTGGRVEITFDTRECHGTIDWEGKEYKGRIAIFTGRISWVSFEQRVSLYASSEEAPRSWQNGWRKTPSIEIKKQILENLLAMIEMAHMNNFGEGFKARFMKKYSDRALCQPSPESPPIFGAWSFESDDRQDGPDGGQRQAGKRRRSSWAPGSGFNNGAGCFYDL